MNGALKAQGERAGQVFFEGDFFFRLSESGTPSSPLPFLYFKLGQSTSDTVQVVAKYGILSEYPTEKCN